MKLKKVLTLRTVVATSAGLTLASSSFVAAVQVAGFLAGNSAWVAILISGMLCILAGACFSELNSVLPSTAGIRLYFGRAFNEKVALTVSILYMLVVLAVVGAESFILAELIHYAIPAVPPLVCIIVMQVLVTVINIRGLKLAGNFQDMITYGLIISLVVLSFWGFQRIDFNLAAPLALGGAENLLNAVAVGVFLFVGFEWVTPLAEEVVDSRLISRGMFIAIGLLSVMYSMFTIMMTANVPREILTSTPVPHLVFAETLMGPAGVAVAVIISLAASITTFNAGIISVSRFFYSTAREHAIPEIFSKISVRYLTPWVSILGVFVIGLTISVTILLTGRYLVLVNMAAAVECLVYTLAGIAVLVLRKKIRDRSNPFIIPWGPVIPVVTSVIFAVLMIMIFITDPPAAAVIISGLAVTGVYVHLAVPKFKEKYKARRMARRNKATGLTRTRQ